MHIVGGALSRTWVVVTVGILSSAAGCAAKVVAGDGGHGGAGGAAPQGNDPACPSAEPIGDDDQITCSTPNLTCHYTSVPCSLQYSCKGHWHHESATCTPQAVSQYAANDGDECAFVGETLTDEGNCTTTKTCESDHKWNVMTTLGPDGLPCP